MTSKLGYIVESPKLDYYPNNNYEYNKLYTSSKKPNKKHGWGEFDEVHCSYKHYEVIKKGFWAYFSKGKNIIECGSYADNGKKFGTWFGYFGGKKDFKDRLKYETNFIDDKIIGIQKFYLKTKDGKTVYLFKEIEYDDCGNLTGKMTKYNEQKNIISKTYRSDNIIIKEKYDSDGNILVHREFDLDGKPINKWFINMCRPRNFTYIVNYLNQYYKADYKKTYNQTKIDEIENMKDIYKKMDELKIMESHPYIILKSYSYYSKNVPECISEIKYVKTFNKDSILIEIYDKYNNYICINTTKNKYGEYKYN
jgi:hypothetical protein